jgi:hypothetical protein
MNKPTVYAVMKVTLEIPVRSSNSGGTMEQMHEAAKRETEGILRNALPDKFHVVGQVGFSHALIKGGNDV